MIKVKCKSYKLQVPPLLRSIFNSYFKVITHILSPTINSMCVRKGKKIWLPRNLEKHAAKTS